MSTSVINTASPRDDDKVMDKNGQEVPTGTIVHCLGTLFKVTDSGIRHFVGEIEDITYFANQKYFHQLNELAFVEQSDVTTIPDAVPKKEGLLASACRLVTAPFSMRMLKDVTTRHNSSTNASIGVNSPNDSMQIPTLNEMILFNTQCNKCIPEEVQFYFHSYADFVTCKDDRLKVV